MNRLSARFYTRSDVVLLSKELIGKRLITNFNNKKIVGIITETEAYAGVLDKASHAYNNRRTPRTETMYHTGGVAYVYLCYGIHHLFNVVTNVKDTPHAILIRGVKIVEGIEQVLQNRSQKNDSRNLTNGPGKVTRALGITTCHDMVDLSVSNEIWIEDSELNNLPLINVGTRIGIDYAEEDAKLPYRFWINI